MTKHQDSAKNYNGEVLSQGYVFSIPTLEYLFGFLNFIGGEIAEGLLFLL